MSVLLTIAENQLFVTRFDSIPPLLKDKLPRLKYPLLAQGSCAEKLQNMSNILDGVLDPVIGMNTL